MVSVIFIAVNLNFEKVLEPGTRKLSAITRSSYHGGVRKARFDCNYINLLL